MLGAEPGDPTEHTYTEIADALRQHGAQPLADLEELWRRIVYSVLITNVDDHLHNHGFLHVQTGQWRLSSAFNVNPFPGRVRELKTWISEDVGSEASIEATMETTPYFQVGRERACNILSRIVKTTGKWKSAGAGLGMSRHDIDAFAAAFKHAERRTAMKLPKR
jgi:serine/threonine-protein kinase HipA